MYQKIRGSIFSRLILFFAVMLLISFTAILIYGNQYLNQRARSLWELESIRAINVMKNHLNEKYSTSKDSIASLYRTKYYDIIPEYLSSPTDTIPQRTAFFSSLDEFLMFYLTSDNDIIFMAMESQKNQDIYELHRNPFNDSIKLKEAVRTRLEACQDVMPNFGFTILPANELSPNSGPLISMLCKVKNVGMTRDLGSLFIVFSLNGMEAELGSFFASYPDSALYIVAADGTVIYDSSSQLTERSYPDFEQLKAEFQSSKSPAVGKSIRGSSIGLEYDSELKLYFLSVLPSESIYSSLQHQKLFIYIGLLLLALISLFSIALFSRQYFARIFTICSAIHEIRSGNLQIQIPVSARRDELSLISANLNDMCTMLNDYIQKVYISQIDAQSSELRRKDAELKQKAAELYALQSQIDPHFLYNTLEAIRMKALASGSREVARMAYLLSTLFKQSLRTGFVTSISEEMDICQLYLELIAIRFPQNFQIEIQVDERLRECGIIRHILQPIIENSVKHGLGPNASHNRIGISIGKQDAHILIRITDNGRGIPLERLREIQQQLKEQTAPMSDRIGLYNVHQRIAVIFGPDYGISLESTPWIETTVTIRIPHMTVKEMESYVQCFNR